MKIEQFLVSSQIGRNDRNEITPKEQAKGAKAKIERLKSNAELIKLGARYKRDEQGKIVRDQYGDMQLDATVVQSKILEHEIEHATRFNKDGTLKQWPSEEKTTASSAIKKEIPWTEPNVHLPPARKEGDTPRNTDGTALRENWVANRAEEIPWTEPNYLPSSVSKAGDALLNADGTPLVKDWKERTSVAQSPHARHTEPAESEQPKSWGERIKGALKRLSLGLWK